ncbi:hypothetical protein [Pacificoceanicola onchidii]|uniref:hypothetical protein n=1 Tax=Pacificoceanicola onchidii TaxID=2562685 RepID=UPI0010A52DBC|nr:hypothetical protein [Pacificoceanicola onchidii]
MTGFVTYAKQLERERDLRRAWLQSFADAGLCCTEAAAVIGLDKRSVNRMAGYLGVTFPDGVSPSARAFQSAAALGHSVQSAAVFLKTTEARVRHVARRDRLDMVDHGGDVEPAPELSAPVLDAPPPPVEPKKARPQLAPVLARMHADAQAIRGRSRLEWGR